MGCRVLRPEVDLEIADELLLSPSFALVGVGAREPVMDINAEEVMFLDLSKVGVAVENLAVAVLSHLKLRLTPDTHVHVTSVFDTILVGQSETRTSSTSGYQTCLPATAADT